MSLFPHLKPKLIPIFLLVVFSFTFLNASIVSAQGLPVIDATSATNDTVAQVKEEVKDMKKTIQDNFIDSVMVGAMKGMEFLLNKIAYDLAVTLASGNWGQSPLFNTKSMGDYWAGVASDAIGTALDSFAQGIGFNLCSLPDPKLDLALKLGLHFSYSQPKPGCTFQQLKDTYSAENIRSQYWGADGENFAKRFNTSLDIQDTDIGIGYEAKTQIDKHAINVAEAKKAERDEGKGVKSFSTIISKDIITPAEVNKDMLVKSGKAAQIEGKKQTTQEYMSAALQKGSVQVLMNAASTFIEAFAGTVVDNFLTKGMFPFGLGKVKCVPSYLKIGGLAIDTCVDTKYSADDYYGGGGGSSYREEAITLFAEELLVAKSKQIDVYDLLSKFTICPESPSPENCIIDEQFAQAVRQANLGQPLTIAQAVEKKLLKADWPLLGPMEDSATEKLHAEKDCYDSGYCYKNLKVLRKARVLPLGFEIAALVPLKSDNKPWTLKEVLEGYYEVTSPFYHLVNPNWVLKIPSARCKSLVYGTQLVNKDSPIRQEECADLQSCVGYDKNGKCIAYGYCLKEKSVWRFNADYCDEQNATCKVLTNSKGKTASYITRTLNSEMCDSENTGCLFYSNYKTYPNNNFASGTWGGSGVDILGMTGYFLNKKTQTCQSKDAGCTALALENTPTSSVIYFKKAPDYLQCYDSNLSQEGVQWPQNLTDFNKLRPIDENECKKYAAVCLPEEENCNIYTLKPLAVFKNSLEEIVTGKFTPAIVSNEVVTAWNDQCDESCVGYNAYKELETDYSNSQDLVYIIPKEEYTCSGYEGCSAFVNLNAVSGGLEQTEYYSDLRLCILPDQGKQKNFYTYEGRDAGGYQLIGYTLLKDGTGAPKQMYRDLVEKSLLQSKCSVGSQDFTYTTSQGEKCQEFVDDQGKKHYAFLSKTVAVFDKCTPYRLVKPQFYSGTNCLGSVDDDGENVVAYDMNSGYCIYNGLPEGVNVSNVASKACPKEMVSCRQYKGNTGNYSKIILNETFADPNMVTSSEVDSEKWGSAWPFSGGGNTDPNTFVAISTESLENGGYSLKITASASSASGTKRFGLKNMVPGETYTISFLAKGNGNWGTRFWHSLNNSFDVNNKLMDFTVTDNWRRFEFTFVAVDNTGSSVTTTQLVFKPEATSVAKTLFIDNVVVKEIKDTVSLVKDKLSVPLVCDANQEDNLPGVALGCRAYKNSQNKDFYLHNFSYLCREGAVGCTKVYDTKNREISGIESDKYIVYNLWIGKTDAQKAGNFSGTLSLDLQGVTSSCFVAKDEDGCFVTKTLTPFNIMTEGRISAGWGFHVDISTFVVPPKSTSPIFLVLNKESACAESAKGCTTLGSSILLADSSRKYNDVFLKIIPNTAVLENALCNNKAEGCETWKSGASVQYFKDPEVYGNLLCEWKKTETGDFRWMLKGSTSTLCYATATDNNGLYLPSFGATGYQNYVGICPADQSGCTMFTDKYGQSESKRCLISGKKCVFDKECSSDSNDLCIDTSKEYFLIDNDKIKDSQAKCEGKVSLSAGCVLLDKTDNPTKIWNTSLSYEDSEDGGGILVAPVTTGLKDANIILKTTLDRECSLWSYCESYMVERNPDTGDISSRCYSLGLCDQAKEGATSEGQCANRVVSTTESNKVLTKYLYQARPVAWNSEEFTGYSVHNSFQIYDLQVRTLKTKDNDAISLLVHPDTSSTAYTDCLPNTDLVLGDSTKQTECNLPVPAISVVGTPKGYCLNEECIYPAKPFEEYDLANTNSDVKSLSLDDDYTPSLSCRGYPEQDSPFDLFVLQPFSDPFGVKAFRTGISEKVNLCASTTGTGVQSCDCSYKKYEYKGKTVYLSKNADLGEYNTGVCIGGYKDNKSVDGKPCNPLDCQSIDKSNCACGEDGLCTSLQTKKDLSGWEGYCFEKDSRFSFYKSATKSDKTCLTWWPVEVAQGTTDLWIYDDKAGWKVTETTPYAVCAYNDPVKTNINSSTWDCPGSTPDDKYFYSQALPASTDGKREWYVINGNFTNDYKGTLEPLNSLGGNTKICNSTINGTCENRGALCDSNNDEYISWQGNYMAPYYIQGKKFGCEMNNDDTGIYGNTGDPLLIKNLPPNATAYYVYAKDDNKTGTDAYSISGSELEKINKNSITKIEVLISDSVKEGIEGRFDNNRLIFYNNTFFIPPTDGSIFAFKDSSGSFHVSSSRSEINLDTCYRKSISANSWELAMWGRDNCGNSSESTETITNNSNGFSVKIDWDTDDNLNKLNIESRKINGTFKLHPWGVEHCRTVDAGDENGSRGMSFIFIVHYTDGTCEANSKISLRNSADNNFPTKPVTWRLVKEKVFLFNSSNNNQPATGAGYVNSYKYRTVYARNPENMTDPAYGLTSDSSAQYLNTYRKYFNYWDLDNQQPFGLINKSTVLKGGVALINYDSDRAKTLDAINYAAFLKDDSVDDHKYYFPLDNVLSACLTTFQKEVSNGWEDTKNDSPVCNMFKKMFTKGWIGTAGTLVDFTTPLNARNTGLTIRPPVIAAPITLSASECETKQKICVEKGGTNCGDKNLCKSFQLGRFSVGAQNMVSGTLPLSLNSPLILRFYAWADPSQMPLRRLMVKKSSSATPIVMEANSVGNRKPVCTAHGYCASNTGSNWSNPSRYTYQIPCNGDWDCVFRNPNGSLVTATCNANDTSPSSQTPGGFGNTTDSGCRETYYEFYLSGFNAGTYQPAVQVLDNWGWCNGSCTGGNYTGNGCYADFDMMSNCEIKEEGLNPFLEYNGVVKVD